MSYSRWVFHRFIFKSWQISSTTNHYEFACNTMRKPPKTTHLHSNFVKPSKNTIEEKFDETLKGAKKLFQQIRRYGSAILGRAANVVDRTRLSENSSPGSRNRLRANGLSYQGLLRSIQPRRIFTQAGRAMRMSSMWPFFILAIAAIATFAMACALRGPTLRMYVL
jgi:hypothetical protein